MYKKLLNNFSILIGSLSDRLQSTLRSSYQNLAIVIVI